MLPNYKVDSPVKAYEKAWALLAITHDRSEFARHLDHVRMKGYEQGRFTLEADTLHIANLFNRHAENCIVRKALALYVPDGITVSVQAVVAGAVQA